MPSSSFLLADFYYFLSIPGLSDVQFISLVYSKEFILSHMVSRTLNKLWLSELISWHCGDNPLGEFYGHINILLNN